MINLRNRLGAVRTLLPHAPLAALSSVCFSLAVLTAPFAVYVPVKLFGAACYAFALHWLLHRPQVRFPAIKAPLAAFLWANLISIWWAANTPLYRLTWYMILVWGIIPLAANVIVTARHLEILCQGLFLESAASGLVGISQFVRQFRAAQAQHPNQLYHYMSDPRSTGLTAHHVHFGCEQMLLFVTLLALLLFSRGAKPIGLGLMGIIGISIVLNLTRSVWLGCLAAAVYLVARRRPRWLWFLPIALGAFYVLAPSLIRTRLKSLVHPAGDLSIAQRKEMWRVGLRMIEKHPWVGVGAQNIPRVYDLYLPPGRTTVNLAHAHLHSNFLQLAAERGLPALGAWLWLMLALVWQFCKIRPMLLRMRWVVEAGIAAWLAMMLQGSFDFNFGIFSVVTLFLFLVSTPFVAQEIENSRLTGAAAQETT